MSRLISRDLPESSLEKSRFRRRDFRFGIVVLLVAPVEGVALGARAATNVVPKLRFDNASDIPRALERIAGNRPARRGCDIFVKI